MPSRDIRSGVCDNDPSLPVASHRPSTLRFRICRPCHEVLFQVQGKRAVNDLVRAPTLRVLFAPVFCAQSETFVVISLWPQGQKLRSKYDIETYPLPCPLR